MSYTGLLNETCDVESFATPTFDDYGQPNKVWTGTTVDCRMMSTKGREITVGLQVVISDWTLFVEDIAVTEQDRILYDGDYYNILLVSPRMGFAAEHHKELNLSKVE